MENSFITRLIVARITRPIADFIAYYLGALDPQELEERIVSGWSLVGILKQRPRDELMAVVDAILESYPDIKGRIDKTRTAGGASVKGSGLQVIQGINVDRLVYLVSEKLPAQGAVLSRYKDWVQAEIKSVGDLLV